MIAGGADLHLSLNLWHLCSLPGHVAPITGFLKRPCALMTNEENGYVFGGGSGDSGARGYGSRPKKRCADLCRDLSYGLTNDAGDSNFFSPETRDIIKAFQIALARARPPEDVDYICGMLIPPWLRIGKRPK